MPPHPPTTERGLAERRADAMRAMRRAEWGAYVQGALSIGLAVLAIVSDELPLDPISPTIIGIASIALGYALGRRHSAAAAAGLIVIVLGLALWRLIAGVRPPALIVVVLWVVMYNRAYNAAREYASLRDVQIAPSVPDA